MENRFTLITKSILGGALIGALLISGNIVWSYSQNDTHPALTDEIVDFYNLNFPDKKLTNQEKQWLIQGAIEEDTGERPIFHFYDPVYNRGIAHFSSKEWALKPSAQANYYNSQLTGFAAISGGDSANDFSYGRALNDYAKGDRERAFVAFGHTLHLLEDAGVPDHTRGDSHPPVLDWGSPYEHEMSKWNPDNFQIARKLFLTREKPVSSVNMEKYFDRIADYSNSNFFSKDTISNKTYSKPNTKQLSRLFVNGELRLFIVSKDSNNQVFPLAIVAVREGKESKTDLISDEIGSYILDGYWDRLSKEVVLNGTGALNLFLTEAEKAKTEYANRPQEKSSWFAKLLGLIGIGELTTPKESQSDPTGQASDGENTGVDNSNVGDTMVTLDSISSPLPLVATPKVTNPSLSPTPLVTKTPVTNVTTPTPSVSPSKTPTPTPKPSATPIPKLTTSDVKTTGRIVINEIAWAGTEAAATDEWIELYNTETTPIDISSWQLVSSDDSPDIIFPEGTIIQANSYFLIERTDNNTVSDITADLAVSFGQGGLNNSGEMVRLFNSAGTVVDIVGGAGEAWYFGDSVSKKSMERIDTVRAGNNASNWKNFSGAPVNKDAGGGLINGTPKSKNSVAVVVVVTSGGGGGGGSSSTPTPTPTSTPTPTPTPSPSTTPTPTPTPSPTPEPDGDTANLGDVVINEIAWMGSDIGGTATQNANAEWIELYNTTNQTINLTDWILIAQDGTPNITFSASINPFGYYLLERTSDDSVPDISADQIYTGALGNTGENLVLKDISGTIIDQVDGLNEWKINGDEEIIGDNDSKETAQRMESGWIIATATPKAENQANTTAQNPSAVTNLVATLNSPLTVSWSAPDPGSFSPASLSYDLRYSASIFTEAASASWWLAATKVASSSLPIVGEEGASQSASFNVAYEYGQTLYFALKTKVINIPTCEVGNVDNCEESGISNIAMVSFPSAIDANSWAMLGKDQYHTSFADNLVGPGIGATISWSFDAVGAVSQPIVSADGDIYFGASDGSSYGLIKLDKNGVQQWEYITGVSIGTPAVLSDGTVYFGRVGAGGANTFTALNSDSTNKWDYPGTGSVDKVTISKDGSAYFTSNENPNSRLHILNSTGELAMEKIGPGFYNFAPVVLENGTIIVTKSGSQFTAYSADGTELWDKVYLGNGGNVQSNPSYDQTTGNTYSAIGYNGGSFGFKVFVIPSSGPDADPIVIDPISNGSVATMVSITPTKLFVGLDYTWSNPASGSKLFSLNKSDLSVDWFFRVEGKINQQIAVDKDGNAYFSTQSGHVYSVDTDGHERWHISTGIYSNVSPVLTENGIIWGYDNRIVLVN